MINITSSKALKLDYAIVRLWLSLSRVRVKHKGQVTIPLELRSQLGIEEGTILEIKAHDGEIVLKPLPPLEAGEVVGEEEHKKIIAELDELRRNWR
jgi:AbrB family looped-hinge helix DNA binding protein